MSSVPLPSCSSLSCRSTPPPGKRKWGIHWLSPQQYWSHFHNRRIRYWYSGSAHRNPVLRYLQVPPAHRLFSAGHPLPLLQIRLSHPHTPCGHRQVPVYRPPNPPCLPPVPSVHPKGPFSPGQVLLSRSLTPPFPLPVQSWHRQAALCHPQVPFWHSLFPFWPLSALPPLPEALFPDRQSHLLQC